MSLNTRPQVQSTTSSINSITIELSSEIKYLNMPSVAGVLIETESCEENLQSKISQNVIVDFQNGLAVVNDNIAPVPRTWSIDGYIGYHQIASIYAESVYKDGKFSFSPYDNTTPTPSNESFNLADTEKIIQVLKTQRDSLYSSWRNKKLVWFIDQYKNFIPVGIESLTFYSDPTFFNKIHIKMSLREIITYNQITREYTKNSFGLGYQQNSLGKVTTKTVVTSVAILPDPSTPTTQNYTTPQIISQVQPAGQPSFFTNALTFIGGKAYIWLKETVGPLLLKYVTDYITTTLAPKATTYLADTVNGIAKNFGSTSNIISPDQVASISSVSLGYLNDSLSSSYINPVNVCGLSIPTGFSSNGSAITVSGVVNSIGTNISNIANSVSTTVSSWVTPPSSFKGFADPSGVNYNVTV